MPRTSVFRNVALVFGGVLVAWLLFVLFFDTGPVDDSDLALPDRKADPAQNPYPEIRELDFSEEDRGDLSRVSKMMAGSEAMDTAFLLSMLEKHAAHLETFDRYAAMTDWKRDAPLENSLSYHSYVRDWRLLSHLKGIQVAHFAANLQREEAIGSAISLLEFAAGLQSAGNPQIEWTIGWGIRLEGRKALLGLMDRKFLEADELERLSETLEAPRLRSLHFDTMIRSEYVCTKCLIETITRHEPPKNRWIPTRAVYKKNRTDAILVDLHRRAIQLSEMTSKEVEPYVVANENPNWLLDWMQQLGGNWEGHSMLSAFDATLLSAVQYFLIYRAQDELLRTRVALERYRIEHGDWPGGLADLVPDYLADVPLDPMDGNPLRYDRSKRVLYSIGEDLTDSGGIAPDQPGTFRSRAEIVIELEPENPAPWPEFSGTERRLDR